MASKSLNNIKSILFDNLTTSQTIFKNTFWLGVGTTVNKLLSLALVIYAARILGAVEYGKFAFALAFVSLLMVFSDFGLSAIITREFAHQETKKEELYSIISLKILLALGTFVLILLTSSLTIQLKNIQGIVLIMSFFLLINSLIDIFYSLLHAYQKMEYVALLEILQVLLIFGAGLFILFRFPSAERLSYAYFLPSLAVLASVIIFFHFKFFPLKVEYNLSVWKKFLTMSWPLALTAVFGVIYGYTDSVMLGYWNMLAETGWYNAASRIAMVGLLPMGFVAASFYPALSKFLKESKEKFQKVWDYELEITILLALPLMVGGITLAKKIIYSFYPLSFSPSILAFQILILTVGLILLYRPFYDAMIISNQQAKTFWITVSGAVLNVVLNLILIPKYTLYGAAVATVITNFLIFLAFIFYTKKFTFIRVYNLKIFFTFLISIISSALLYFVIKQPLIYNINIFLLVFIGVVIYFAVFLGFRRYIFKHIYV